MDVVYPLKRGSASAFRELRYSLRSLVNVPHGRVFVVGGKPSWLVNATHLPADQQTTKWTDATNNVRTACMSAEVSDPFVLMNDDFFITSRIDGVPVLNRGTVRDVLGEYSAVPSRYVEGMRETLTVLEGSGFSDPLSFELHVPMVVDKQGFLAALDLGSGVGVWHKRTAYGALAGLSGERVSDVKVYDYAGRIPSHLPFVSTSNASFLHGVVGKQVRGLFPQVFEYER